ncbi:MAG: ABC transporter ATP-binding protein [Brevundimonas sp.]
MTALLTMWDADVSLSGRLVLNGADIQADTGELVAIVGPNGAGKTTLLKAFAGLLPLTRGIARLQGDDVRTLSALQRAERVAYLPQDRRIAWNLPAIEVASLGAPFLSGPEALDRAHGALAEVDAAHLADRGVAEMSGGERARVLLARAFVSHAPALLADEPAAGLDPDAQLMVMERLRDRARSGRAVLVSLHDLTLAARYADRVVVLEQGSNIADGPPRAALSPEILKRAFGLTGSWIEGPDGPLLSARRA